MSTLRSLHDWLTYIERQHPQSISLGLERVRLVLSRLTLPHRACVFTVGGTNGKGSTTAMLEAMLHAAGYRTGRYSSPHLLRYNERVRVDACDVSDATLVEGFEAVERAREGIALTYFEYGTLAAIWTFAQLPLDAWVMEVGLGGRLDAGFLTLADTLSHIRSGKLRALGVASAKRISPAPEIPTIAEQGYAGYEADAWQGFTVPANTPAAVIARLNDAHTKAASDPEVRRRLLEVGIEPIPGTAQDFASYIKSETAKWGKLVRDNKITVQ